MASNHRMYGRVFAAAFNKEVDFDSDTINVALVLDTYFPDYGNHDYWNDVVANEHANANGYTTNGVSLGSKAVTFDGSTLKLKIAAADVSWTASGGPITARYAVIYDRSPGSDATRPLISCIDLGANQTATAGGTFNIQFNATTGLYQVTVA